MHAEYDVRVRKPEDQNLWYLAFSLFFLVLVLIAMALLAMIREGLPHGVGLFDAALMTLAAFRLTRLLVYDEIIRFFREWFVEKRVIERDGKPLVMMRPLVRGVRATIHDLLECPWCIGIWSALVVSFFYFAFAWAWYPLFVLALAGASSLLQFIANVIGREAKILKYDVAARESEHGFGDRNDR